MPMYVGELSVPIVFFLVRQNLDNQKIPLNISPEEKKMVHVEEY